MELCAHVLDLDKWTSFQGYGLLPAISDAEFHLRTEAVKGTIIAITCADGSSHFEEVTEWSPPHGFTLKLHNFSPPLKKLATHFDEEWVFQEKGRTTLITRRFEMYPARRFFRPAVWLISRMMRGAVKHQMKQMREDSLACSMPVTIRDD